MFRRFRVVVGVCLVAVFAMTIIGWVTGFLSRFVRVFTGRWDDFVAWLNSPFTWDHLLAGAGVLIAPIILLVIIVAIADN